MQAGLSWLPLGAPHGPVPSDALGEDGKSRGELRGHPDSSQSLIPVGALGAAGAGEHRELSAGKSHSLNWFSFLFCTVEESTTLCWPPIISWGKASNTSKNSPQSPHSLFLARRGEINIPRRSVTLCRAIKRELYLRQCREKEKKLIYKQYYDNLLPAGGRVGSRCSTRAIKENLEGERGSAIKGPELR